MQSLFSTTLATDYGEKKLQVYCCDVVRFDENIDILTTSAFQGSYAPTPFTIFKALQRIGICVHHLARDPLIDLRKPCNTWLSHEASSKHCHIRRIGCIEMLNHSMLQFTQEELEQALIHSFRSYFYMLDIAAIYGVEMETVALPLLGSGNQNLNTNLVLIPLLNECISFLKRNACVKRICFIEINEAKANQIAKYIQSSLSIAVLAAPSAPAVPKRAKPLAFISYASGDRNIADNLCSKLEQKGIAVWYAPRNVQGPYATAIASAIEQCTHFVVVLSENSMLSEHVLNEIDLAFQRLPNNIKFKPLRVDHSLFTPSFKYYLSRQHWMDATDPPLEKRLNEFVEKMLLDLA